jgi:hypothetical protein
MVMKMRQLTSFAIVLAAAAASGGLMLRGGYSTTPSYPNWEAVAESYPCDKLKKIGREVKVIGPLVVDGKLHQQHTITEEKRIKIVDERCNFRNE